MARFADASSVTAAINDVLAQGSFSGWVLVGYQDDKTLVLQGKGNGGVSELVQNIKEDEAQFCLVRIDDNTKGSLKETTRDIFIAWYGPGLSIIKRGKKTSDLGTVQKVMKPFHADITAVNKENFNETNVRDKSMPLSGSHVID
eukprot:CAMPEP_0206208062 /NCGR_PEP_ID=MMETSP0166-20121206/15986_1 /ASSEMBLY_ACC=CAM_ASM_000260 /TAXON_ID=95228 /ORGANISM="Vannella robusta, Strain DIVA3 518/3/11/1/6" /LENGTH=143 /DNA_ID=CAMNT_0053628989 /DNA_START=8 /DNA_END=439 /DNA_ORIENTATION=+